MEMALHRMAEAGYVYIGMDHFALPDDELAVHSARGRCAATSGLYRATADVLLVPRRVGDRKIVGHLRAEPARVARLRRDYRRGGLAVLRGMRLSSDDAIRRRE